MGMVASIMSWKMFPILCCFLLPSVCGDCVCSGGSSGTSGLGCVLEDVSNNILFSVALCVWRLCLQLGFWWDWWPGLCVGRCF